MRYSSWLKILPSVWAFKNKGTNGVFTGAKARGNAGGHRQVKGVHYNESYAPTTNLTTFRVTQSIAVEEDMTSLHVDVDSAFLYGVIPEGTVLYMSPFEGFLTFDEDGEPFFYLLVLGIYGLVQAALLWNQELVTTIVEDGYTQCSKDPCLFVKVDESTGTHVMIPVHVDDLLPTGKPLSALHEFEDNLGKRFNIKKLGEAKWFSAMLIHRTPGRIHISQEAYINDLCNEHASEHAPKMRQPLRPGIDLYAMTNDPTYQYYDDNLADGSEVRSFGGTYAWPADCVRPDLSWSRMQVARKQSKCSVAAFELIKQTAHYLKHTADYGIAYYKGTEFPNQPIGMVDTGFASCRMTRKSEYCFHVYMNGGPIFWKSRMIPGSPSGNTFEAELHGLYEITRFLRFLYILMCEMHFPPTLPLTVYGDNESALLFAKHARVTQENRHVDLKYCILSELFRSGFVDFKYIPSAENLADIGTKAMVADSTFELLRDRIVTPREPRS